MNRLLVNTGRILALSAAALGAACAVQDSKPAAETARAAATASCDTSAARDVVQRFGERLRDVSLLAPDSAVSREMREAYAPFVATSLLDAWIARPSSAPGRKVSSPWPARIEIDSVQPVSGGGCRVVGDVVYLTSVEETRGGVANREHVTLRVANNSGWRVAGFDVATSASPDGEPTASDAADVVRRYYAAVNARDFRAAYGLWTSGGAESRQTLEQFSAGFDSTRRVIADVGEPGRVEGAAGSRYVTVPVMLRAETTSGETQRFAGTYTLRRSVVDGASLDQRQWRIYSAAVRRER